MTLTGHTGHTDDSERTAYIEHWYVVKYINRSLNPNDDTDDTPMTQTGHTGHLQQITQMMTQMTQMTQTGHTGHSQQITQMMTQMTPDDTDKSNTYLNHLFRGDIFLKN